MQKLGLKHNLLYQHFDSYSQRNFELLQKTGTSFIEIDCHFHDDILKLDKILPHIKNFRYVTLHLPNDLIYEKNEKIIKFLKKIETFYSKSGARLAVVHPDRIKDTSIFDNFNVRWAVENMDDTKNSFNSINDFVEFFSKYKNWSLVLDINHCYSLDKTLQLAEKFLHKFMD